MSLAVRLLGAPAIEREGVAQPPPRGRKAWALLAYLVCEDGDAPSREQLAELLFPDANDPLGAVRWNLAQLRRALGPEVVRTRSVELVLPPDAAVDVRTLKDSGWEAATSIPGLGRDLLEGMTFPSCPALETWLLVERRRLLAAGEAALREAVVAHLAAGETRAAVDAAARLVGMNPYDDSFQELLIHSYAAAGDLDAAKRQLAACIELFRRELRRQPAPSVVAAARVAAEVPTAGGSGRAPLAREQLDAGQAAMAAGAIETGLDSLADAVAGAESSGDEGLLAQCLLARGAALISVATDSGEEGASDLARAASIAPEGLPEVRAAAARESAYLEIRCGRYQRCGRLIERAAEHAGDNQAERARLETLHGVWMSETGWHDRALPHLQDAIDLARVVGDRRQEAHALSMVGRLRLVREEVPEARESLDAALELAKLTAWTAFRPWPEALLGHVELAEGDVAGAATRLEHAFALAGELQSVSLQGISERGLALAELRKRGPEGAIRRLQDAVSRGSSAPAAGSWVQAYVLDALCEVAVAHDIRGGSRWVRDLRSLALRTGMREFGARAWVHQAMLSGTAPGPAAPLLFGVQNERLAQRVNLLVERPVLDGA